MPELWCSFLHKLPKVMDLTYEKYWLWILQVFPENAWVMKHFTLSVADMTPVWYEQVKYAWHTLYFHSKKNNLFLSYLFFPLKCEGRALLDECSFSCKVCLELLAELAIKCWGLWAEFDSGEVWWCLDSRRDLPQSLIVQWFLAVDSLISIQLLGYI